MPPAATALGFVWTAHRKWSAVATNAGNHLRTWRMRNLILLVLGALLGVLSSQEWVPGSVGDLLLGASAVVLASAAWIQQMKLGADRVQRLTVTRAASESLKSAVYWYLAGVSPYDSDDRDKELTQVLTQVDAETADYQSDYTRAIADDKQVPHVTCVADYALRRAEDQRDWHAEKITIHEVAASRLRAAESAATLLAAVFGAVAALSPVEMEAWIALLTTVGATLAAHLLAAQHDKIATSYGRTATQLTRLIEERTQGHPNSESDAQFVQGVERVIALQNEGWVALLGA